MSSELTQEILDKECKYAKLDYSGTRHIYAKSESGPELIYCKHEKAGHKDSCFGVHKICIASEMHWPEQEYFPFSSSNYLPTMNKCEFKTPLVPDKDRHTKRLYAQQMIYTKAARMQTKISDEDINITNDKDVEGMIALTIVNYLKSKDYDGMDFKERLKARQDITRKITYIAQDIEKNLEARV